ncbi:MAG: ABC transporter permease [Vicinamibacterales bacterium]
MGSLQNIRAIAMKELKGYYASPVAWVMLGLFAFIFGVFFRTYVEYFAGMSTQAGFGGAPQPVNVNDGLIRPLLSNASVLILFILPMVTMRTYAEEKRSGTIELLLTSPLRDSEIVLGKFFGAVGLYAGLLLVSMVYVAILFRYAEPEFLPLISGYLGLLLLGSCFISMGLFISSTTKNQMVAGAATFVLALFFWIVSWMASSSGPMTAEILRYLSITDHFEDFGKGVIDTKHLVYYLSFIAFGIYLTLKAVETERWRG